ncbi:MAG: hypothetical protein ABSD58_02640 [Verrucomicrobiia bacterium]|jgi:hypothetical protein
MRGALGGAAALLVAATFFGCNHDRCDDKGPAALQATVPHLSPDVVSNLVREATLCIADAMADANAPPFYTPTTDKAPVAYGLRVEPPSQFSVGMGSTVVVRTRGTSAPYMAVRVPLHVGPALCLWGVYVCVKPGGGFAQDNPGWVVAEGSTNAAPVVTLGDEVRLYAQLRQSLQ